MGREWGEKKKKQRRKEVFAITSLCGTPRERTEQNFTIISLTILSLSAVRSKQTNGPAGLMDARAALVPFPR
jgi:hypothetical protein